MEKKYIEDKIKLGEGAKVEFKESKSSLTKDFYETAVSFSNCDGGIILLGVEDDGTICGVDRDRVKQIKADIATNLNSSDCVNPSIYINPIEVEFEQGIVIVIQVPSSSQVHSYKGDVYIRSSDVDINISGNDSKVQELHFQKSNKFTEAQIYPYLTMDDLDSALFAKARNIIRSYSSDHPWLFIENEQLLKESTLWRIDYRTGESGLTLASALIFGKDVTIQNILPAYKVESMTRKVNKDRWDDRLTLRTNLIDTYLGLKGFINKHLPEKFYLENDQRIDLRDKIFREVVGNVVVHREYTSHLSTEMIIYNDSVIVTNPNKPFFHGIIDPNGFNPHPKNPNIRKFFTAFGWTDEIGSGVRNTNKYLPLYSNGATPVFREDETFKTEVPLVLATFEPVAEDWIAWMEFNVESYDVAMASLSKIDLSLTHINLKAEELIINLLPSWHENATKLNIYRWPKNQAHTEKQIKNTPSWDEKSTQLLNKRVRYYISILCLTAIPIGIKELTSAIGYNDEAGFKNNYIKPLREIGFVSLTIPDKPTSPDNKYIITPAGKNFLAGKE